jgi:hypothetical protein
MRHVGHEVAPHRLGLLQRGDVARQQHAAVARVGMHLHRQPHHMAALVRVARCRRVDDHVAAVVPRGQVGHEGRVAHQVGQVLRQVALGVDAELAGRRLVAPFDAALLVEQHHAVGRGLDGGQELLQPVFGLAGLLLAVAQQLADALGQLAPHAGPARRQARPRRCAAPAAAVRRARHPAPATAPPPARRRASRTSSRKPTAPAAIASDAIKKVAMRKGMAGDYPRPPPRGATALKP